MAKKSTKKLKSRTAIGFPAGSKKMRVFVRTIGGRNIVQFSIEQQTFNINSGWTMQKQEAMWYAKCLRYAFKKLEFKK